MAGSGLSTWLAGLGAERLGALLATRPDACTPPVPADFGELAGRLSTPSSVRAALEHLSRAGLQLAEVLQALGPRSTPARLAAMLGPVDPAVRDAALAELRELALLWDGPDGTLQLVGPVGQLFLHPLRLGRPVAGLLDGLTVDQLAGIGLQYDERAPRRKAEWQRRITELLTDDALVRRRLAQLPPAVRDAARTVALDGPEVSEVQPPGRYYGRPRQDPASRLAALGWLLPTDWNVGEMPREVALAIRGPEYHPPLDPAPPPPATRPVTPGTSAGAALGSSVDGVARLLDLLGTSPLAQLRAGGVGARELRRAAKELAAGEVELRLWLELAAGAGLLTLSAEEVLPTEAAAEWLAEEPPPAAARLLAVWFQLAHIPGRTAADSGKAVPVLAPWPGPPDCGRALRADLLALLTGLPASTTVSDVDEVVDVLAWRRPLVYGSAERLAPALAATWTEAGLLGVVCDGAPTPLAGALLAGDEAGLAALATGLLPTPTATASFLPDLTAVVAGTPARALAATLDRAADNEARDTASTWRFTPSSVRRALDGGAQADELLAELAAVADTPLPQPLQYLVRDVARRHGQVRVLPTSCCVCTADAALAAELLAHRRLAPLRLHRLADTVLASPSPVAQTLAALRDAGYAPVRQDGTGTTVVEASRPRRADPPPQRPQPGVVDHRRRAAIPPDELARRLVSLSAAQAKRPPSPTEHEIAPFARQLSTTEVQLLAHAVEHRSAVHIDYLSASGGRTSRVVEPDTLLPGMLVAWCRLRDGERHFLLERIMAVAPGG